MRLYFSRTLIIVNNSSLKSTKLNNSFEYNETVFLSLANNCQYSTGKIERIHELIYAYIHRIQRVNERSRLLRSKCACVSLHSRCLSYYRDIRAGVWLQPASNITVIPVVCTTRGPKGWKLSLKTHSKPRRERREGKRAGRH